MKGYQLNIYKAVNAVLYVAKELGGNADCHKTYKLLYFADQKHLAKYGRPVVGDTYIKMKFGPVPSFMKDLVEGKVPEFDSKFSIYNKNFIEPLSEPDLDYLSDTDLACLQDSISENKNLSFDELCKKSHKLAWKNASYIIDYEDIFKEVSVDVNMLKYIKTNILNNNLQF